jgi:peptidyl-prolyl cis-trans isomerase B (cyclophilin B)
VRRRRSIKVDRRAGAVGLVAAAALVVALTGCGDKKAASATSTDASGCVSVTPPTARERHEAKPASRLDATKTYTVHLTTNCGTFAIRLAVKTSPETTASFVSLVRKGYFDGTIFHRIVPGFVVQGGDPTGTGTGGPGYSTVDPPPASTRYTLGLVAMAKAGNEAAGAAGSQFFVVTAQDAQLPPDYAVLGEVVSGLPVVDAIGKLGDPSSGGAGTPTETVEIQKATVDVH